MFKLLNVLIFLFPAIASITATAQDRYRIDEKSDKRIVCGLSIARQPGLIIDAVRISESSLRNRIDNERYNACPYRVTLKYHGLTIPIDFSNETTLQQVKNFDEVAERILRFGTFIYDETGWHVATEAGDRSKTTTSVQDSENSVLVVGNWSRKGVRPDILESCIDFLVAGNERWAIGGICAVNKSKLEPLQMLFKIKPVLSFEKIN